MNAALLRPLPGRNTSDLYTIFTSNGGGGRYGATSFADFQSFLFISYGLWRRGLDSALGATEGNVLTLVMKPSLWLLARRGAQDHLSHPRAPGPWPQIRTMPQ